MNLDDQSNDNIARHLPMLAVTSTNRECVVAPQASFLTKLGLSDSYSQKSLTFNELNKLSLFYAHHFKASGMKDSMKALVFIRPCVDFSAITFALFRLGVVPVFIDPGMGLKNLLSAIEFIKPDIMVSEQVVHLLRFFYPKRFKTLSILVNMGALHSKKISSIKKWKKETPDYLTKDYDQIMELKSNKDDAAVLFTSGGTGIPKAVRYTHEIFNTQLKRLKETFNLGHDDIDLPGFPLFGLFTISMGMKSVIPIMNPSSPSKVNPRLIIANIKSHKTTFIAGSPAIWHKVANYCVENDITLPSVKQLVMFGAPVSLSLHESFKKILTNGSSYTPYGATECLPVANISAADFDSSLINRINNGEGICVGKALSETQIKIAPITDKIIESVEEIQWLNSNELGEICVYSKVVTPEYIDMPEKTALAKIKDPRGGLWHRMGDLGHLDEQGLLWFAGRKSHRLEIDKNIIGPVAYESIFNSMNEIERCALVSVNNKPTLVVKAQISKSLKLKDLILKRAKQFNSTLELSDVHFVNSFPVDVRHNIKIDRLKIKSQLEAKERT